MSAAKEAFEAFGVWCGEVSALLDERAPDVTLGQLAKWYSYGVSLDGAVILAIEAQNKRDGIVQ